MRKVLLLLVAVTIIALIHEGVHGVAAFAYGEYKAFHVKPYGLEVEYETPVEDSRVPSGPSSLGHLTC